MILKPNEEKKYPPSINTKAKQALFDNLGEDEELANRVDETKKLTKEDGTWGNMMKERKHKNAIKKVVGETKV